MRSVKECNEVYFVCVYIIYIYKLGFLTINHMCMYIVYYILHLLDGTINTGDCETIRLQFTNTYTTFPMLDP